MLDLWVDMVDVYDARGSVFDAVEPRETVAPGAAPRAWLATMSMNVEVKKRLPEEGVEWLFSRVVGFLGGGEIWTGCGDWLADYYYGDAVLQEYHKRKGGY